MGNVSGLKTVCKHNVRSLPAYYGWVKATNAKRLWYKHTKSCVEAGEYQ